MSPGSGAGLSDSAGEGRQERREEERREERTDDMKTRPKKNNTPMEKS